MRVEDLVIGEIYRQKVDSDMGYEDWIYIGLLEEIKLPRGMKTIYAFQNDIGGTQWFDEEDISEFEPLFWSELK